MIMTTTAIPTYATVEDEELDDVVATATGVVTDVSGRVTVGVVEAEDVEADDEEEVEDDAEAEEDDVANDEEDVTVVVTGEVVVAEELAGATTSSERPQ
jgi:hypothetical protein